MYSPRWPWLLPLGILVPWTALSRTRLSWLCGVDFILIVGPLMGLNVSSAFLGSHDPSIPRIRLLTCNVHRHQLDAHGFSEFVSISKPDIISLQDWTHAHFDQLFGQGGWHVERDGELCVASRYPIQRMADVRAGRWSSKGSVVHYGIQAPWGRIHLLGVHLASPHEGLQAVFERARGAVSEIEANMVERRVESIAASAYARELQGPLLLAGDFNTPVDSTIYSSEWSQFSNGFSSVGNGFGYTYFTRRANLRIDQILAGAGWRFQRCWIGPHLGSPHRPLVADLDWEGDF